MHLDALQSMKEEVVSCTAIETSAIFFYLVVLLQERMHLKCLNIIALEKMSNRMHTILVFLWIDVHAFLCVKIKILSEFTLNLPPKFV